LGEGEAAFLSLVMQAANSEPIDDMSVEPAASLPDQLLESFIVRFRLSHVDMCGWLSSVAPCSLGHVLLYRAHAMKDSSSSSSDDGLSNGGKKRKYTEENEIDALHDVKDEKEHGLEVLRKGRSDALDGLSSLSREGSWSDNDDGGLVTEFKKVFTAEGDSDRTMTDANPAPKRRYPSPPSHSVVRCS
jgi:hypothetical protein